MNYSYGEMIHRYLDGILPEAHERELFDELARNSELRRSFGAELELQNAAAKDSTALLPPESVRAGVFSVLDIPLASDAPEIAAASSPQLLTFTSIALVSMLFGGMIVWFGMQGREGLTPQFAGNVSAEQHQPRLPLSANTTAHLSEIFGSQMTAVPAKNAHPIRNSIQFNAEGEGNSTPPSTYISTIPMENMGNSQANSPILNLRAKEPHFASTLSLPQFLDIPTDIPMTVSMRGMQGFAGAEGVALTALYTLDDEQALGVEVSTAHLTRFEQRKIGGIDKRVSISEPSTIIGSVYRISLPSMSIGEFAPYIQSFVGASTKGMPVGRTTVGLQWTPDRRVTLSGGIDGMIYGFQSNGQWQSGVMTSLVYGVSVVL